MPKHKYDWKKIDWRLSNREIAAILKCPYDTVAKRRYLLNAGRAEKPAQRSDKGISRTTYLPPKQQQIAATFAAKNSPKSGKFETNCHAKKWRIVSPTGQVFVVKNLYHFVRENSHLFNERDTIFKTSGGGEYCNATAGLFNVSSGKAKSWKGWKMDIIQGTKNL